MQQQVFDILFECFLQLQVMSAHPYGEQGFEMQVKVTELALKGTHVSVCEAGPVTDRFFASG